MADIRYYLKEKEKREQMQAGYKEKIVRHKLTSFYRILLVVAVLIALTVIIVVRYKRHIYTDYDLVSSVERESTHGARDLRLGNAVLTYSKDGAHCTDATGRVVWNQTFEIQDVQISVSGSTVAIGDYNGRSIYIANSEKLLGEITTTMPIRAISVSQAGYVTAVLADTDIARINMYNLKGELLYEGKASMDESGYPVAVCMSPGGELLCVSYVYVDAGVLKSNVAFYNFQSIGDNKNDNMVSIWIYTDTLMPYVQFMNDETSFAVGDNRLTIFSGGHIPAPLVEHLLDREIRSVFYNDRYIGLVYSAEDGENQYQLDVYTISTEKPKSFYFDMDYTDIYFGKSDFVIYNETECMIMTMDGIEKFRGAFPKSVSLMLSAGNTYKYILVTDDSIDTIRLK
jgi:hypothetical protein